MDLSISLLKICFIYVWRNKLIVEIRQVHTLQQKVKKTNKISNFVQEKLFNIEVFGYNLNVMKNHLNIMSKHVLDIYQWIQSYVSHT